MASAEVASPATAPAAEEARGWFGGVGNVLSRLSQAVLGVASEDFEHWFKERYGHPTPSFCQVSFGEAVHVALSERRLLLAWFHQEEDAATESLCMEVLQNEAVLDSLREGYTLWAGDVCRFEPCQIARLLGIEKFPALVIMLPQRNGFSTPHYCVEWPLGTFSQPLHRFVPEQPGVALDPGLVMAALTTTALDYQEEVRMQQEQVDRRNLQVAEDRLLREQQDREYEEALLADQIAAVASMENAARIDEPESVSATVEDAMAREEEEKVAAERAAAEKGKVEQEEKRKRRGEEILAQPQPIASDDVTVARISLRLPSGDRLQRVFRADQQLHDVYEWAHCCRSKPEPANFQLCINFPARSLTDRTAMLQELDLVPSAALVLKEADS
eukprot:TRINITY_DN58190_c0_g1_i1.p1 TRINITY_DN58190_c0_g1~~TRINITY_DN58190_c0_g1_i1.p1  ORF type:complete len:387 (+),score=99.41 TRINITY_DN58190_c0_g1_i1:26-1186(+)